MAERNLAVDHVTLWRWVQRYAPELDRRCRRELRMTSRPWRVDETYVRIAGRWTYLYRAVDSAGDTIDFLLSSNRDAQAAKTLLSEGIALAKPSSATGHQRRREPVVSEGHYRTEAYRRTGPTLPMPAYSLLEQYRGAESPSDQAPSQSQSGVPVIRVGVANHSKHRDHAQIRKGQVRWLPKDDILGHALFIAALFGVSMAA
jgi:transposase, IS6 family